LEIFVGYILKGILLPPALNLFALLIATIVLRPSRLRSAICVLSVASLWVLSTPFVADWLARTLETRPAFVPSDNPAADAIVVLSASSYRDAPEYGGRDTIASDTLERIRYGAYLAHATGLPVAVTGGAVFDSDAVPLGELMAKVLEQEYDADVRWVETESENTAQNAAKLRAILPVDRVILVTHALHMPRSVAVFEKVGFEVIPAPMGFRTGEETRYDVFACLPSVSALAASRAVLHEWLGLLYYHFRY